MIVGDQRTRPAPSLLARLWAPRACTRCCGPGETLPADAFDLGPSNRKRRKVCRDCLAGERAAAEQFREAWRATFTDPRTGRKMRRCSTCREVKQLTRKHFAPKKKTPKYPSDRWNYACRPCQRERTRRGHQRRRRQNLERERALNREKGRRYRERLRKDPERLALRLERDRYTHRLRRIMQGRKVSPPPTPAELAELGMLAVDLPTAPLAAALERARGGVDIGTWCGRIGVSDRMYQDWRLGKRLVVDADRADRILGNSPLLWFDVWPEGSEGHERAAAYFTGASPESAVQ